MIKELIKDFLFTLFHPSYWIMNEEYSKEWDDYFNNLMKKHSFVYHDKYYSKIGNNFVWIANHPYASFTPETNSAIRPSRRTIYKAYKKYNKDCFLAKE